MMHLPHISFRSRLLISMLIPVFLIQCFSIAHEVLDHKEVFLTALEQERDLMLRFTAAALAQPMHHEDPVQIQTLIRDILAEGRVAQVQVFDASGAEIFAQQTPGYSPAADDLQASQRITYTGSNQTHDLGYLQIALPISVMAEPLHTAVLSHLTISTLVLMAIALIITLALSHLSRPLGEITQTLTAMRNGNFDGVIPGRERRDEIGLIAQALHQLHEKDSELAELRAQDNESARRESKRIRRALQSTRDGVVLADETGKVVLCNPNGELFFGDAQIGRQLNLKSWLPADLAAQTETHIRNNESFAFEATTTHNLSGHELNLLVRGGPIRDERGSYLGSMLLASDHSDQARQAERVRFLAEHDSLTGLPNRRLMEQTLATWLQQEGEEVSVLLADLDHFKQINDTLGHPAGDELLRVVAHRFESCASTYVMAARLGGDEFAILVKGADSQDRLTNIANRLVAEMAQPQEVAGQVLHTGMSAGIATLSGPQAQPSEGIRRADLALYEAKRGGRGMVEIFHETLETEINRKSLLEGELRRALAQGDLRPVFQVQTDLASGEVIGFETLARWHHRQLGTVSPAGFIPIAEDCGLIRELTYQMMTQAFRAAARWHEAGFQGRVAVNLSPKLFGAQVDEFVNDCLFETNCPASAVEAEITETVVLASGQSALREIQALQELGVTVALDDFGMGYSSLSYLQKFPVDKIKVDAAFVSKLPESEETRAIVGAIAELGHALGMRVTGEGAETDAHRQLLKACGVDYLQGYFDGPPLTERAATARLFPSQGLPLKRQG
ncbi:bifunctional diguanylate cyclase/phosphodiesterase [Pseudophaeobacter sp. EL27]|uniref:putative bifunctional diguanylate cyclase/phosphodiesterase n=1 Tax=Pseudophaeobacter sp. EL27 TaxID=2107580 RepID=UPI000EFB902C|nr:EAL domain-containing protein [Pseudophaeobacter sp. EL27]